MIITLTFDVLSKLYSFIFGARHIYNFLPQLFQIILFSIFLKIFNRRFFMINLKIIFF